MDEIEALAWAAGFIDGDGTIGYNPYGYLALHAGGVKAEPLHRLRAAVGCGSVSGPYDRRHPDRWSRRPQYSYQAYAQGHQAIAKLWFALGTGKRDQALSALNHAGPAAAAMRRELSRVAHREIESSFRLRLAWAAGFFDAEGCFSSTPRVGVCASITQTDREVLDRFRNAVRVGKIYGPYATKVTDGYTRKAHFSYRAHGNERVQAILAMLWPWLGTTKRQQAIDRLVWTTTCRNGHPKKPGHTGCGECTKAYWAARREARRQNEVREPAVPYLPEAA